MTDYIVSGAAVVLPTEDGSERYLYRGAPIAGDGYTKEGIKHALSVGLIEKVKAKAETSSSTSTTTDAEPYKGVTIPDLTAEIEKRNADREDDKKIASAGTNRPDLVAALVADDEASK